MRVGPESKPADYRDSSGWDNRLFSEIKKICGNCSRPVAGIFFKEMFDIEDKVKGLRSCICVTSTTVRDQRPVNSVKPTSVAV